MYGGLFGDLPATKKEKDHEGGSDEPRQAAPTASAPLAPRPVASKATNPAKRIMFIPGAARKRRKPPVVLARKSGTAPVVALGTNPVSHEEPREKKDDLMEKASVALENTSEAVETTVEAEELDRVAPAQLAVEVSSKSVEVIVDPYDPLLPNDLLDYWRSQEMARHRVAFEEEQRKAKEAQEKERRAQLAAGNYQHLQAGRGRGLSNLPKWLVDQQNAQARSNK